MSDKENLSSPYGYFDDPNEYFSRAGHGKAKLTKQAAIAVCDMLTERGIYVMGTSAGYWHNPGYEERHEYGYWRYPHLEHLSIEENNDLAKREILENSDDLDAFLIWELKK